METKVVLMSLGAATICHIASLWYSVTAIQLYQWYTNYAGGQLMDFAVCFDGLVVP